MIKKKNQRLVQRMNNNKTRHKIEFPSIINNLTNK